MKKAARKVLDLLKLRQLWSRLLKSLPRTARANPVTARARVLQAVVAELGQLLQKRKKLFSHVHRVRGTLQHRNIIFE